MVGSLQLTRNPLCYAITAAESPDSYRNQLVARTGSAFSWQKQDALAMHPTDTDVAY